MKQNYSELKTRLEKIIDSLQSSEVELDEAIKLHEEGQKILKKIDEYLADMEAKIKDIKK